MTTTEPIAAEVEILTSLLRGELSAVETYDKAIDQFAGEQAAAQLHRIRDEHQEAVNLLRGWVIEDHATPPDHSGPWGVFASAVTTTARVIGPATVLHALRQGEMQGIDQYEAALTKALSHCEWQNVVRERLLPDCRNHVLDLDHLMAGK